jgi:hypothetical protein
VKNNIKIDTDSVLQPIELIKSKVHLRTGHEGPEGEQRYSSTFSLTLVLNVPRPGRFTCGKHSVSIV